MHFALKKKPVDNYQRRHYALHSCWGFRVGWGGVDKRAHYALHSSCGFSKRSYPRAGE